MTAGCSSQEPQAAVLHARVLSLRARCKTSSFVGFHRRTLIGRAGCRQQTCQKRPGPSVAMQGPRCSVKGRAKATCASTSALRRCWQAEPRTAGMCCTCRPRLLVTEHIIHIMILHRMCTAHGPGLRAKLSSLSGHFQEFLTSKVRLCLRGLKTAAPAVGQGPVQSRLHCTASACDSPALTEGA